MYFKNVKDGYILGFGIGNVCEEITEAEYTQIKTAAQSRPTDAPDGYTYRLRTDLTWELVELPPAPAEPTVYTQTSLEAMTNAELTEILAALGISANMNKANMVRLILAAQEVGI